MRPKPYIGITGVMSGQEVDHILASAVPLIDDDRQIMFGLLASSETLDNRPNHYPYQYPQTTLWASIFSSHPAALNLIHFNTRREALLMGDLDKAHRLAGELCHGFQLNIAWPHMRTVASYKALAGLTRKVVVLQCGSQALEAVGRSPSRLLEKVKTYQGAIDYLLIDPSGGFGVEFDVDEALRYLEQLAKLEWLGFGVAGGLCAATVYRLEPILREFPGMVSFDAQARLRTTEGHLNINETVQYVLEGNRLMQRLAPLPA